MKNRDAHDALTALAAMVADLAAIWTGQMLAVWIRFDSGWIHQPFGVEPGYYAKYALSAACSLAIYLCVFQILKLYSRPQDGHFSGKVPRLVRASLVGGAGLFIASALLKNIIPFSNTAILLSLVTVTGFVLVERFLMFRLEIALARRAPPSHRAIILGANADAARYIDAVRREPRQRMQIAAVLKTDDKAPDPAIPPELLKGDHLRLAEVADAEEVDMLVLAAHNLSHDETVELVAFCEQHLIRFNLVPDLFHMMTSRMNFQMVGNVPVVGIGRWPLDEVWNRIAKRLVDIVGALVGLVVSLPFILVSAVLIRLESPGPVFYAQERCGRRGRTFRIYKLRTMRVDAEATGRPGWTKEDDPRRTRVGGFLRRWNIDELPQFWNVLKGEMSLVGPRPERPYFVEQFTPGIEHYMWRHVSKPGLTGWAQVNGLRGDTSISERVKYDLYYLENWSLAFDFKILVRTLFTYRNAC